MIQTAPGRYAAEFPTDLSGAYHVHITQQAKGQPMSQQSRGLVVNYEEELRIRPANEKLLESIAQVSGGTFRPAAETIFTPDERTASQALPLWPYLLIAAALIFVADVALRRIDFDLLLGRSRPPVKMVWTAR
jgi:hypothetical protein